MPSEKQIEAAHKKANDIVDTYVTWEEMIAILTAAEQVEPAPAVNAKFETSENGITGTKLVDVKRVEREDDGSLTVVIDYWPEPAPSARSSEPEFEVAPDNGTPAEVLAYILDCARRWNVDARIIGNARAGDIERAISACLNFAPAARSGAVKVVEDTYERYPKIMDRLTTLDTAEPATDVEPVAWMLRNKGDGNRWLYFTEHDAAAQQRPCHDIIPLYRHPPESRLREALVQIANNTCCDGCQEADLVARAALAQGADDERS